jgi:hypothetical protein
MGTKHHMSFSSSCPIEPHPSHRSFILSCANIDLCGIQVVFHFSLHKLMQDYYDVASWPLLFLLPQWYFVLHPCGWATRHNKEKWIWCKHFSIRDWKKLVIWVFFVSLSFDDKFELNVSFQHDSPIHKHLFRNLVSWTWKEIFLFIFMHCKWYSYHKSTFYYIICIWTFSN